MNSRSKGSGSKLSLPQLEAKLLVASRHTCCICWKSKEVQIHHIVPKELGGDDSEDNLIVICLNCHSEAHTRKDMARNLSPLTLKLYRETWLDLVRRFPCDPAAAAIHAETDLTIIRSVLKAAHRRALYFPFDQEFFPSMFDSLDDFRLEIQRIGFGLLRDQKAREHVHQIYKALIELGAFGPGRQDICNFGYFGKDALATIDLKRKTVCFHVNELAKLAGLPEVIPEHADIDFDEIRRVRRRQGDRRCFGRFDDGQECQCCDFRVQCIEASAASNS